MTDVKDKPCVYLSRFGTQVAWCMRRQRVCMFCLCLRTVYVWAKGFLPASWQRKMYTPPTAAKNLGERFVSWVTRNT